MTVYRCPIRGCKTEIAEPNLLCPRHWFQVPAPTRTLIWRLFKSSPGSFEHRRVCFNAIGLVNSLQPSEQQELKL